MPNSCWNTITITGSKEDIYDFTKSAFKDVPEWALHIHKQGTLGIHFDIWSRWTVDTEWLEEILAKYPSMWIKDIWKVEDGQAGIWIGSKDGIRTFYWDDLGIQEWYEFFEKI